MKGRELNNENPFGNKDGVFLAKKLLIQYTKSTVRYLNFRVDL